MAGGEATYPVKITFDSPGACPPVYVAGSFTVPEWQPQELEYSVVEGTGNDSHHKPSYKFFRTFDIAEGAFQYKFRLGHEGEWWVCDGNEEIVTDSLGNQNNLLVVVAPPHERAVTSLDVDHVDVHSLPPNPQGDGKAVPCPEQDRSADTLQRRRDPHGSTSLSSSTESEKSTVSPPLPANSILQRILQWLKSIFFFFFHRKSA